MTRLPRPSPTSRPRSTISSWATGADSTATPRRRWTSLTGSGLPYVLLTWHWLQMTLGDDAGRPGRRRSVISPASARPPRARPYPAATCSRSRPPRCACCGMEPLETVAELMAQAADHDPSAVMPAHGLLARAGLDDRLRAMLVTHPPSDEVSTGWSLLADWAFEAEAAGRRGVCRPGPRGRSAADAVHRPDRPRRGRPGTGTGRWVTSR